jgi:hypothetical protein
MCEWGCCDWIRVGQDQADHEANRCPKRILACPMGCPVKLSEEQWLEPLVPLTQDEKDMKALSEIQGNTTSNTEGGIVTASSDIAKVEDVKSKYAGERLCYITLHYITLL